MSVKDIIITDSDTIRQIVSEEVKAAIDTLGLNKNTELMTRKQVAEYFNKTISTIKNWEKRGLLTVHTRLRKRPQYLRSDVIDLEKKKQISP